MSEQERLFVRLLGEAIDVWRPVAAEHLGGARYRIAEQDYDRETETWEFEPGEEVVSELVDAHDGIIRVAVRRS